MRAEKKRGNSASSRGAMASSPRGAAQPKPKPAPTKPVVSAPVVEIDAVQAPEQHPQRREGNLSSDAGVKVIRTTSRDVRRRERETRAVDGERLGQAGTHADAARRPRSVRKAQDAAAAGAAAPAQRASAKVEQVPSPRPADSQAADEQAAATPVASRRSAAAQASESGTSRQGPSSGAASPRELVTDAQGFFSRAAEYARTHARLMVALGVLVVVLVALYGPVRDYYVAWRRQGVLQAQYNALAADHDSLESEVDRLQSREGIEDEARRQGYTYGNDDAQGAEGAGDDAGQGSSPSGAEEGVSEDVPWYVHVGDVIFFYTPPSQG